MNVKDEPCITIGCVNAATRILGDKWTPRLLRALHNDECSRFCQIQTSVGGINPRTLSSRLHELENEKVIQKLTTSSEARPEYELTVKGKDLIPIIERMHEWSVKYEEN